MKTTINAVVLVAKMSIFSGCLNIIGFRTNDQTNKQLRDVTVGSGQMRWTYFTVLFPFIN